MREPAWYEFPGDPIRSDFRNLLYLVWEHLGLPDPTPGQYEMAYFMQWGYAGFAETIDGSIIKLYEEESDGRLPEGARVLDGRDTGRADILEGFRGIGKSYIAAAFSLWKLLRDPLDEKILVVSASSVKAREFVAQVKGVLMTMDLFAHLRPRTDQRDMVDRFDVNGASLSQSPSLKAAGIDGQITGSRSTTIIADDIEIPSNSSTEEARAKLLRSVNEFDAILVPGRSTVVLFLGTPQTEESIYNRLVKERGFNCYVIPARYPRADKRKSYVLQRDDGHSVDILAPFVRAVDHRKSLEWKPVDPARFGEIELTARESKGRSFFMLQYMLDTSLSDAERYPLKQHDFIVMPVNRSKAPITIQWGRHTDGNNVLKIPNVGFSGDYFLGPLFVDKEWREYEQSVLFVDPSGRGKDECAWAVVKVLHGIFYVPLVRGLAADVSESMRRIATDARDHNVNEIVVEPNYGGVMWINGFQPILAKVGGIEVSQINAASSKDGRMRLEGRQGREGWSCSVFEAEWSKGMKEARIIDTLEPMMNQHRIVIDPSVAEDPVLMYQLTHLAKERKCLQHDDRVEALAGAINRLVGVAAVDMEQANAGRLNEEWEQELEDFVETCRITRERGMRTGRARGRRDVEVYQSN